jgi:hypothetical protein
MKILTDISSAIIPIVHPDFQVIAVHNVHFLLDLIDSQASDGSKLSINLLQSIFKGEFIQAAIFSGIKDITNVFIKTCSDVQTALLIANGVIEANFVVGQLSQDAINSNNLVESIPVYQNQLVSATNDELVVIVTNGNNE